MLSMAHIPKDPGHQTAADKARTDFFFGVDQDRLRATFNPNFPYSYCRICGWLYQPSNQRKVVQRSEKCAGYAPNDSPRKQEQRRVAVQRHNSQHTPAEIRKLSQYPVNRTNAAPNAAPNEPPCVLEEAAIKLGKFGLKLPIAGK